MSSSKYIIVVGCGRLGSILASQLSGQGHSVVVIDNHEERFRALSAEFSGFKIAGDATELANLEQAKVSKADCLFAVTDHDNTNLMVAQSAKLVFKVPIVMARVFDPAREKIYQDTGIQTISPTRLSTDAFIDLLNSKSA